MGDLSKHFDSSEFRCKHTGLLKVSDDLIEALQELRDMVNVPIKINSGYRHETHPIEKRKSNPGVHTRGIAADIVIQGYTVREMYDSVLKIKKFRDGGIGVYPETDGGFIHVDVRPTVARWGRVGGKYISLEHALKKCR